MGLLLLLPEGAGDGFLTPGMVAGIWLGMSVFIVLLWWRRRAYPEDAPAAGDSGFDEDAAQAGRGPESW